MKTATRFLFAASTWATLALALAFTFSACSDGGGGGEPPISEPVFIMLDYGGQTYKTVAIGTQTWFAENLNYNANGGVCYNNSESNCANYGKLYDYNTAMAVCPPGWHLPTREEWLDLERFVGDNAGRKLKAKEGWNGGGNGTDNYGFAALPGGGGRSDGYFSGAGNNGSWWSGSVDITSGNVYISSMHYDSEYANLFPLPTSSLHSVRCLQD